MAKVQVGLVQMSCVADKTVNLQKAIEKIKEAAAKGAQIICLQELFTSLYFCDTEDYDNFSPLREISPTNGMDTVFQIYNRNETDQSFTPPIPIYNIKRL